MASAIRVAVLLLTVASAVNAYLEARGDGLYHKGQKVFLSGTNYAWNNYGQDFGDNKYFGGSKGTYEQWLKEIADAGGNAVRFWLHVEGYVSPSFDSGGFVTGTDSQGTLAAELKDYLDAAQRNNIFIIPVLWNGAYLTNQNAVNLIWDESKLQSYIDKALKPMVEAVKGHPALAAWEIVNEPEGSVKNNDPNSNPCFDTTPIAGSGAGWTGLNIPMQNWLKFINWQIDAIKEVDSAAIATQGAWSERSQTNNCGDCRNYFTNECLIAGGGKSRGTIDFYQMHTYSWQNSFSSSSPFKNSAGSYGLDKPVVIGEFAASCSEGNWIGDLFQHAYTQGYAGAWSWQWNGGGECSDSAGTQGEGMRHIRGQENGGNGIIGVTIG